jgi:hypothetical protein
VGYSQSLKLPTLIGMMELSLLKIFCNEPQL